MWTCSMHPQIKLPNPGKCPICGMQLIPVKQEAAKTKGQASSLREITLSPEAQKLAMVQVSRVIRKPVHVTVRLVGKLDYDERKVAYITAWVSGRLDRLYVDFTGTLVQKGQPMIYLYSPELLAAQAELIHAIRASRDLQKSGLGTLRRTARETIVSAREKLRLWGLTERQIQEVIRRGIPSDHMTIVAPISGTVVHKAGFEGMYVKTGTRVYTIADLSTLWLRLDAYESDLAWIQLGAPVRFETESYPGDVFTGRVSFIDPFLNERTRTIKVRVDVPNPDRRLLPGMFVHAELKSAIDGKEPPLVIPDTAPLLTGKRAVVYVAVPGRPGTYEGREIVLGPRADRYYVVKYGLREGEVVVTNGNFKIDSAVQIMAKPSMMTPEGGGGGMMMHHGGKGSAKKMTKGAAVTMKVPETFKQQVQAVLDVYPRIARAVEQGDWTAARAAYGDFKAALNGVDGRLLTGHLAMLWGEYSMLLNDDVVVGLEARKPGEKKDAFESLQRHIERLREKFKLSKEGKSIGANPLAVPVSFRNQLRGILQANLRVHRALTSEDLRKTEDEGRQVSTGWDKIDLKGLKKDLPGAWRPLRDDPPHAAKQMDRSEDLQCFRRAFAVMSETVAVMLKTFQGVTDETLYRVRCTMAFDGGEVTWIQ